MQKSLTFSIPALMIIFAACTSDPETTKPIIQDITESVYASGVLKSKNQYQAFSTVSGIVDEVFVDEGTEVNIGSPLLSIVDETQKLRTENLRLAKELNDLNFNRGKIEDAKSYVSLTRSQLKNDSINLVRQKSLWNQNIGTKVMLEQKELSFKSSKATYESSQEKLKELERQLKYLSTQSKNNLLISNKANTDFIIKSKIKGKIYQLNIEKGELVGPQLPIAIIGDDEKYVLQMQIDEYDIVTIKLGMPVMVVLNSYRDSVFKAVVTKINPIMNVQSKTFTIEGDFVNAPDVLYPNISFEANVLVSTKKDALLIPRNLLLNDSTVVNKSGKKMTIKTGMKDYQMVEILSGIDKNEELILPEE